MKNFKLLTILILTAASFSQLYGQRRTGYVTPTLEELPCFPVDTIRTADPETDLILFSNNTWRYYRPTLMEKYGDLKVYNENWDTTQVFSYRHIEIKDLPSVTELSLIGSLDDFHPPVVGKVFSKYGWRGRRNHNGVDIPLRTGDPIYATFDGRVRLSKYNTGGFGNLVIVRHPNGLETWHAHLCRRNVEAGEFVKAGQIIGYGGNTGRSRGPHLHFEVRYCDQAFDPEHLFNFADGQIKFLTFALEKNYLNINSRASDQLEDHDFDDMALTNSDGEQLTSEDILNHIAESQSGRAGQGVVPSDAVYHTIVSGDMLGKLAIKYGVSIDHICRMNNITRTTVLKLGRRLRIR